MYDRKQDALCRRRPWSQVIIKTGAAVARAGWRPGMSMRTCDLMLSDKFLHLSGQQRCLFRIHPILSAKKPQQNLLLFRNQTSSLFWRGHYCRGGSNSNSNSSCCSRCGLISFGTCRYIFTSGLCTAGHQKTVHPMIMDNSLVTWNKQ